MEAQETALDRGVTVTTSVVGRYRLSVLKRLAFVLAVSVIVSVGAVVPTASADVGINSPLAQGLRQWHSGVGETTRSLSVAPQVGWNAGLENLRPPAAPWYRLWDMKVAWRDINPSPGVFDWSILDRRIAQVEAWGGRPLLVLGLTPQWAAADPNAGDSRWGAGSSSPPANLNTWSEYVSAVANRYGNRIGAYEVWNEANLKTFWTGSAKQMADMTRIARDRIKATSPGATILTPSVTTRLASGGRFTAEFLEALAADGVTLGTLPFDAFAIHSYPAGNAGVSFDGSCSADPAVFTEKVSVGLPPFAPSTNAGVFVRWLKSVRELVAVDEPLFVVSDGTREYSIASSESGLLQETRVEEGAKVKVGQELAILTDGQTPDDCVDGRTAKDAAQERVADVVQWQMAVLEVGDLGIVPIWDTEINYGLAGPGIIPGVDWNDEQGAELMRYTFADSAALGIDNTFWYEFTAEPFDLLGVQMTPETPATLAAWSQPQVSRSSELSYDVPVINGCRLSKSGADCAGKLLRNQNLSGFDTLGADFRGADMYRSNLSNANFGSSALMNVRLYEADLTNFSAIASVLNGSNLRRVKGKNADFRESTLSKVNFGRADLQGADFREAYLVGAKFNRADLRGANFYGANLTNTNFFGADLRGANFCNSVVTRTNFSKAKLAGAKCL